MKKLLLSMALAVVAPFAWAQVSQTTKSANRGRGDQPRPRCISPIRHRETEMQGRMVFARVESQRNSRISVALRDSELSNHPNLSLMRDT